MERGARARARSSARVAPGICPVYWRPEQGKQLGQADGSGCAPGPRLPRRAPALRTDRMRARAGRLRDLPGGDEARVKALVSDLGVELVGRPAPSQRALGLAAAILRARGVAGDW